MVGTVGREEEEDSPLPLGFLRFEPQEEDIGEVSPQLCEG